MKKTLLFFLLMTCSSLLLVAEHLVACDADDVASGANRVWLNEDNGTIKFIEFNEPISLQAQHMEMWLKNLLKTNPKTGFSLYEKNVDKLGYIHYRFRQTYEGYVVNNAVYYIHTLNRKVISANGDFFPNIDLNVSPIITIEGAIGIGKDYIHGHEWAWPDNEFPTPQLHVEPGKDAYHLTYKTDIYATDPLARKWLMIDAVSGEVVAEYNRIHNSSVNGEAHCKYHGVQTIVVDSISPTEYRLRDDTRGGGVETYDLNNSTSQSSGVDFIDADNIWNTTTNFDDAALDAHWGAEGMYDYFLNVHGRDSYDGNGAPILSYVHYGSNVVNAFWNGEYMTYGDGNGSTSFPLTSTEVVGHEIMHGITEFSAGLIYSGESGALNESYSDCFGVILDYELNPLEANFLMGDVFSSTGTPFRNMGDPNEFSNPDTYLGDFWASGGVHNQSGVQNFWFYLVTQGGVGTNDNNDDYMVSAISMADAADILYRSLSVYLTPGSPYADARFYGIQSAVDLFGDCTDQVISVTNGWHAVGVGEIFNDAVIAGFVSSSNFNCQTPATIQFSNTSFNGDSYLWDFGDGTTSTATDPIVTYSSVGTYTVSLIANGNALCGTSDTIVLTDFITVTNDGGPTPPSCLPGTNSPTSATGLFNFTLETINNPSNGSEDGYQDYTCTYSTNVMEGILYPFSVSTGLNENIRIWIDVDDNGIFNNANELVYASSLPAPTHEGVLIIPGTNIYGTPLRLRIKSDISGNDLSNPCAAVVNGQVEDYTLVVSENNQAPAVDFVASETLVLLGSIVDFTDLTQNVPENWSWQFPGGTPTSSNLQHPSILYPTLGVYPVSLTATNSIGQDSVIKTSYITVSSIASMCAQTSSSAPTGIFYDSGGATGNYQNNENCSFLIDPGCALEVTMTFTVFITESFFENMFIYDGVDETAPLIGSFTGTNSPGVVTATSGKMFIVFTSDGSVTNPGWEATWSSSTPTASPVGEFSISDNNPPINIPVDFSDLSTEFPGTWYWDFGDGNISTVQNPSHAYSTSGTYDVEMIVGNCFDFDTVTYMITVQEPPAFSIDPASVDVVLDCGDSIAVDLAMSNIGLGDLVYEAELGGEPITQNSTVEYNEIDNFSTHIFNDFSSSTDSIFLEITINGDFDNIGEFASLFIDGNYLFDIEDGNPTNGTDITVNYIFSEAEIADWIDDGVVEVYLENSNIVDSNQGGTNTHTVSFQATGSFWAQVDPEDGVVQESSNSTLTVYVNSTGLAAGNYSEELEIMTNDPANPFVIVPVNLEIVGEAEISFSATCLDFPLTMQYTTSTLELVVINNGCDTLEVSDIFPDDSEYSASSTQSNILPHATDTIMVSFTPTTVGGFPSNLNFVSNIPTALLCLNGDSFGAPAASVDPASIDVILNCGDSTSVDLMLSNIGLSDLIFEAEVGGEPVSQTSMIVYNELNNNTTHTFSDISPNTDSVYLQIILNGDFDNIGEFASLYIDGNFLFEIEDGNPTNGVDIIVNYAFDESEVESWISDGVVEVYLENSSLVDDNQGGTNSHTVTIQTSGSFWAEVDPADGIIQQSSNEALTVFLNSTGLAAGIYTDDLEINSNDPLSPNLTVPITLEVVGDASINFSTTCLNFPETMQYTTSTMELVVTNDGCDVLDVFDIFPADSEYSVSGTQLSILPFQTDTILVSFSPITIGGFPSNLTFVSNIPDAALCLSGTSFGAPAIAVNPASINIVLNSCEDSIVVPLTVTNTAFDSLIYSFEGSSGNSGNLLDSVKARLNQDHTLLTDLMPNFYLFFDGEVGTFINDGGGDMYDGGNQLSVDNGSFIQYSNDVIVPNLDLGTGGKYFTRKYPGLFVFAADINGVDRFSIDGNLGADGAGFVAGAELTVSHAGSVYKGFVKRVHNSNDPSINHLIIMKDNGGLVQTIPTGTSFDDHDIDGLTGTERIYYLLFAEALSALYTDAQMEAIMSQFLEIVEGDGFSTLPEGTFELAGGSSQAFDLVFTTNNTMGGIYNSTVTINSNDPLLTALEIPVTINVTFDVCADFNYNQPIACGGQIDFNSAVVNAPSSYLWDFGDGNTSTEANPTHIYTAPGNYTVTLTVENASSTDVVSYTVSITDVGAPITACQVGSIDLTPTFDITRVVLNTIDNPNPNNSNGYTDYTCEWSTNLISGVSYDITIEGYSFDNENVRVWIDLNNSGTFEGSELLFEEDNLLSPHNGQIVVPANAVFSIPLRMRVACDAWFNNLPIACVDLGTGEFEDYTVIIESNTAPPEVNFSANFIDECQGVVQFNDLSTNFPTSWTWDFGDGSAGSTLQNPIHTYADAGTYMVTLTATNDFGTNTFNFTVTVNSLIPIIQFVGAPEPNTSITFQPNAPGAITWSWNFGDGNTSTEEMPTHTYTDLGTYIVSLTVTNSDGCVANANLEMTIVVSGIEELESAISIYPNPTDGNLYIRNTGSDRYYEIVIVNAIGQVVKRVDTSQHLGDTYHLQLENYPPGMYVLELKFADNQVLQKKFVLH